MQSSSHFIISNAVVPDSRAIFVKCLNHTFIWMEDSGGIASRRQCAETCSARRMLLSKQRVFLVELSGKHLLLLCAAERERERQRSRFVTKRQEVWASQATRYTRKINRINKRCTYIYQSNIDYIFLFIVRDRKKGAKLFTRFGSDVSSQVTDTICKAKWNPGVCAWFSLCILL